MAAAGESLVGGGGLGEGELGVRRYVEVVQDMGYAGPWGVEVLSEQLRNLPMDEIFRRSYETTAAQFLTRTEHE